MKLSSPDRNRTLRGLVLFTLAILVARQSPSAETSVAPATAPSALSGLRALIFSKTVEFRHASIPAGIAAIEDLALLHGFTVDKTEDGSRFNASSLAQYDVVIFLNTTGDVLTTAQEEAFMAYIQSGGGYVGIHSASDTEHDWEWYGELIGAHFLNHPSIQTATIRVEDPNQPSTSFLPPEWIRNDEWYNFKRNPRSRVQVLLTLDETTYTGGTMGDDHPIAWQREFDGGRAWYTAGGHTTESYAETDFRSHLLGGIQWAAGNPASASTAKAEWSRYR